ncbi:nucleotidyltransferase family protein [Castellaniella defragrans]|uniref:Molybdenum cofactor cytidylyltransferase n=1 Tax=Castellaniella defragrans TaxID=75697 RepID=A0A7W9TQ95_CASDE|nr:nucleotidyltransferase family protein [Castellaniella defragrans]KAB0609441.1 nucleotidyltransferase family protein [Castellaniella defragrans]MBB6084028.1 molybdenum cofactor cytidylyltransferase [Castellaniella defragrans]
MAQHGPAPIQAGDSPRQIAGILLAAGRGTRFDPTGQLNKLMQPLADGTPVAAASASALLAVLPDVIAIVRDHTSALSRLLASAGCRVLSCPDAGRGMAASLVCGILATPQHAGCLIALADMPFVQQSTLQALVDALTQGADIAAPVWNGHRGNPVAFSAWHRQRLLSLEGDRGARALLQQYPVREVIVTDPGILRDIDTPSDLPPTTHIRSLT